MHSFIIISADENKRKEYIDIFCTQKEIGKFDKKIFTSEDASFGIALVRDVQNAAFLKPSQSKEKALILENAQTITPEAQNALLKLLEEPPNNTYIFLSCTTDAYFLPTILSRCKTIALESKVNTLSEDSIVRYTGILDSLMSGSVSEKLVLAEKLAAKKESLPREITDLLLLLREKMLEDTANRAYPVLIENLQKARSLLETTNVSPRIILEHIFLELT
ncbi:MAG TPA: hypothetical protein VEW42_02725 [Candidatus Eisenbacteria bacterium]|nr:hypothetical protein [Candidatus Eisenbacteria bacterium]